MNKEIKIFGIVVKKGVPNQEKKPWPPEKAKFSVPAGGVGNNNQPLRMRGGIPQAK